MCGGKAGSVVRRAVWVCGSCGMVAPAAPAVPGASARETNGGGNDGTAAGVRGRVRANASQFSANGQRGLAQSAGSFSPCGEKSAIRNTQYATRNTKAVPISKEPFFHL